MSNGAIKLARCSQQRGCALRPLSSRRVANARSRPGRGGRLAKGGGGEAPGLQPRSHGESRRRDRGGIHARGLK
jgi:hypothetical protein